jgi:hypothetical protein
MNSKEITATIAPNIKAMVVREFRSGNSMEGIALIIVPSPIHTYEGNLVIVQEIIREVLR